MRDVRRSALLAYPPGRIFALINDVERYPEFLPWCRRATIDSRTESAMVATIAVSRGLLNLEFTTRNTFEPDRAVHMALIKGPFRTLEGHWDLTPLGEAGCRIGLHMRFAFAVPGAASVFEPLFADTAASLVDAFVARARALHG
jgi:ribosome-associated toxin RatA of RatAB toxin-antitoxin module